MISINRLARLAAISAASFSIHSSQPAMAVVVMGYDVFSVSMSKQSNPQDFALPVDGGKMPWWKDQALAALFAQTVLDDLGSGSDPLYGPIFAYDFDLNSGQLFGVYQVLDDASMQEIVDPPPTATHTLMYAIASEPVPIPLPLFGAAAGFAWSRRIRHRLHGRDQAHLLSR
jgi:hypothetical protein